MERAIVSAMKQRPRIRDPASRQCGDAVLLHQPPHRRAADLHLAGGGETSPLLLASVATIISRSARSRAAATLPSAAPRRRVLRARTTSSGRSSTSIELAARDGDRALDDVLELADVAGIWYRRQRRRAAGVLPVDRSPPPKRCDEVLDQQPDVARALAERRQVDAVHVEAIEQVAAEVAAIHALPG